MFLDLLTRDVVAASEHLLGAILRRGPLAARIVEVEAYRGNDDPACHAFGKSKMKNMALFGPPGHAYIYFCYGTHWMLNVSAHREGEAAGILIRAAQPLAGLETFRERRPKAKRDEDLLSGPGKLATAFDVTPADNGVYLFTSPNEGLTIEPNGKPRRILSGPRVGIAEGKAHERPWRFVDGDHAKWASRPHNFS